MDAPLATYDKKGSFFSHLKGSIFYFNNQPPMAANVRPETGSGLTF